MADDTYVDTRAPRVSAGQLDVNYSLYDKDLSLKRSLISEDVGKSRSRESILTKYFGPNSMKGAIFNLIVAIVGAGILSFPFAIRSSGLLLGLCLLILCTCFAYISLNLLITASDYLPRGSPSYLTLSMHCGGPKLAMFTQLNVILSLLGSAISRMVGAGGIIVILYIALFGGNKEEGHKFYVYFIIGFSAIIIFPLSLLRDMSSLRFTSLLSVSCSLLLTVCLFVEYFILCNEVDESQTEHYKTSKTCFWNWKELQHSFEDDHYSRLLSFTAKDMFTSVPLSIFHSLSLSLSCVYHVAMVTANLYLRIQLPAKCIPDLRAKSICMMNKQLENKTTSKMRTVFRSALSISLTLYIFAGSFAFLIFLQETCGNILLNDFHSSPEIVVSSMVFVLAMILATPVFVNAIRENINNMIWKKKQIALLPHVVVTLLIVLLCVLVSAVVTDIATVFGFIGCTTNPITGYILPTYFVWKLVPSDHSQHRNIKRVALVMVAIVVSVSFGSLYFKIMDIVNNESAECGNVQEI